MKLSVSFGVPKLSVEYAQPVLISQTPYIVLQFTGEFPVPRAKLDDGNNFVLTLDGTVHRSLYCTPSYFAEDFAVKPNYA